MVGCNVTLLIMGFMLVQTCVRESQLKYAKASPCRVLVGNQDPSTSVTTHYCLAKKWVAFLKSGTAFVQFNNHCTNAAYAKGVHPQDAEGYWPADAEGYRTDYGTFGDWYRAMYDGTCSSVNWILTDPAPLTNYTFNVTYTITGLNNSYSTNINSQTGSSGISSAGFAPFGAFDYYFNTTVAFANLAPTDDPVGHGGIWNFASLCASDASIFWASVAGFGQMAINFCTFSFAGSIAFPDHYTFAHDRFFSQTFTFGPGFQLTFNELGGGTPGGPNPSGIYDLSNIVAAGDAVTIQIRGAHAVCGWQVSDQFDYLLIFRQLAKLNGALPKFYFIGRLRSNNFNAGFAKAIAPTTSPGAFRSVTLSQIDIISSGTILGGQIIGLAADGADIAMAFPHVPQPFPLQSLGADSVVLEDYYFAVIGTDPSSWAAANGYKLGLDVVGDFPSNLGAGDPLTGAGNVAGAGGAGPGL